MLLKSWFERRRARKMCEYAMAYLKPTVVSSEPGLDLGPASPIARNLGHGLLETYVVDKGNHFEMVQSAHLQLAGVEMESFRAQAVSNLFGYACNQGVEIIRTGHVWAVVNVGGIEASLILADDFWERDFMGKYVENSFTVSIPARDVLGFCDSRDDEGKQELRDGVQRVWGSLDTDRKTLISDRLFTRVDGAWLPEEN